MKEKICVIGGGSWGATLANHLAQKGSFVTIWEFNPELALSLKKTRSLKTLPQLCLHNSVQVTNDLSEALQGHEVIVSAVPSEFVRQTFRAIQKQGGVSNNAWVISVTKGIENDSLKLMSDIIIEELPSVEGKVSVLAGPSHAEEVSRSVPTAVVSAGPEGYPEKIQTLFTTDRFRVYKSPDLRGVEYGGALKNIYAIACGVCDGLGLGDNTKAALMTRALNEMTRIGIASGVQGTTFFGLSGLGDLIVTCMSRHSRNRLLGQKVGEGKNLKDALSEMTMVAEGVRTTKSGFQLSEKLKIDLPIIKEIYFCLYENKSAKQAMHDLMTRPVSGEMTHVQDIFKSFV